MKKLPSKESFGEGVYYRTEDYASLPKRFLIMGIDFATLVFLLLLAMSLFMIFFRDYDEWMPWSRYAVFAISYLYLAVLKRTDFGTLGYWLTGVKIVNLKGKRPSLWQMTFRLIMFVFGPFNFIADVVWLGGDENRQTLRDKVVGTYVVKDEAIPLGQGEQILVPYFFLAWSLMFREVKRALPANTQSNG
jgi:uncharacterized RDD family membrane protein YckC